jgi:ankyrin repeat protein
MMVSLFIAVGCKKRPTGTTLTFFQAAKEGNIKQIKSFISNGTDINTRSENGMTPLHWAARFGRQEVVELLITKGADVNAMSKYSGTPLCLAAQDGHKMVAEVLIAKGADVDGKDQH